MKKLLPATVVQYSRHCSHPCGSEVATRYSEFIHLPSTEEWFVHCPKALVIRIWEPITIESSSCVDLMLDNQTTPRLGAVRQRGLVHLLVSCCFVQHEEKITNFTKYITTDSLISLAISSIYGNLTKVAMFALQSQENFAVVTAKCRSLRLMDFATVSSVLLIVAKSIYV